MVKMMITGKPVFITPEIIPIMEIIKPDKLEIRSPRTISLMKRGSSTFLTNQHINAKPTAPTPSY